MTDQDVIDYLSQNPDFFNRNPGLIDQIQVPSEQGVISLSHHAMAQLRAQLQKRAMKMNA